MKAGKWNYETHAYENYELPKGSILFTYNMDAHCKCAACGSEMVFENGYSSLEIQDPERGFGYCVCPNCHSKEFIRYDAHRKQEMRK